MNHLTKAAAILLAAAGLSCSVLSASADGFDKGDYNMDGVLDSNDALLILHMSMNPAILSDDQIWLADFNSNGVVEAEDALLALRAGVWGDTTPYIPQNNVASVPSKTQVAEMEGWAPADVVERVGPLFTEDQRKTGILASVSIAQFILESGYGQSKLSIEANNCFGIKGWVEDTPRENSPWDGVSVYTIATKEYDSNGYFYYVNADFRKYDSMEDSIADHSSVLINSSYDGVTPLYDGIVGCTDYRKAAQIIYDGGYCTAPDYVDVICSIIESWDLTQYDLSSSQLSSDAESYALPAENAVVHELYRVRSDWNDEDSQLGAYQFIDNAIECADLNPGTNVYDSNGNVVYTS